MKRKLLLLAMVFALSVNTYAQQAEAQLLFEEAETLYNKFMTLDCESSPQDCQTTLMQITQKLDGAEKIVGEKPKIVYLSALVQKGLYDLFDYSHLYDNTLFNGKEIGEQLFDLVFSLRETANKYLTMKQNDEVDDRYREMKKIVDELKQYPADKQAWQKEKQRRETEEKLIDEALKIKAEKLEVYYREIAPKIDAWEWNEKIKIGGNFKELKKQFPEFYKGLKTNNYDGYYSKVEVPKTIGTIITGYKDDIIDSYTITLAGPSGKKEIQKEIEHILKTYFGENLIFEKEKENSYTVIVSPYSKYTIGVFYGAGSDCFYLRKYENVKK